MLPVFITPEGMLLSDIPKPSPIEEVTDYAIDMVALAQLAEEEARKASTHKKVTNQ